MKKYKKKPTKLFQVRMSEKEHKDLIDFINSFGITHREFLLSVQNELCKKKEIRSGKFY